MCNVLMCNIINSRKLHKIMSFDSDYEYISQEVVNMKTASFSNTCDISFY